MERLSPLSAWLPEKTRANIRKWAELLDPRALQSYTLRVKPRCDQLEKGVADQEALERETLDHVAGISRAFVGRVVDGGEALWDMEYLFPEGKPVDPTLLCRRLLVPKVLSRAKDVCRYCGHPVIDHWGDNCGGCQHGLPGVYGSTMEGIDHTQGLPGCPCVSMGLPDDWVLPAHKEGAHAPV